ncbi:lysM and putative peptidoglycan-binding domain-containing protein 1 isoform X22 [Corvus hawaiiensis]|uniref:lysM and putative peptidoglycan-binding domain-containing protein 1 isoform X22 n=1 Tax=Corvus hawaiiensis TaxID=134902 RepID=UPI002018BD33|nr:lysM and putative peptidoglycan-binding domain-containing protein 1 isoform X22 [Corvus hawaiiensis]
MAGSGGAGAAPREHRLQPGDTLPGLALRYGVTMEQIQRANRLYASDTIFLKPTLLIPAPARPQGPFPRDRDRDRDRDVPGDAPGDSPEPPSPSRHDLSASDFLQRLDAEIGRSKEAAAQRLRGHDSGPGPAGGGPQPLVPAGGPARTPAPDQDPAGGRAQGRRGRDLHLVTAGTAGTEGHPGQREQDIGDTQDTGNGTLGTPWTPRTSGMGHWGHPGQREWDTGDTQDSGNGTLGTPRTPGMGHWGHPGHQERDTGDTQDTGNGTLGTPRTPGMGHPGHQERDTGDTQDTGNGTLGTPRTPGMGHPGHPGHQEWDTGDTQDIGNGILGTPRTLGMGYWGHPGRDLHLVTSRTPRTPLQDLQNPLPKPQIQDFGPLPNLP